MFGDDLRLADEAIQSMLRGARDPEEVRRCFASIASIPSLASMVMHFVRTCPNAIEWEIPPHDTSYLDLLYFLGTQGVTSRESISKVGGLRVRDPKSRFAFCLPNPGSEEGLEKRLKEVDARGMGAGEFLAFIALSFLKAPHVLRDTNKQVVLLSVLIPEIADNDYQRLLCFSMHPRGGLSLGTRRIGRGQSWPQDTRDVRYYVSVIRRSRWTLENFGTF